VLWGAWHGAGLMVHRTLAARSSRASAVMAVGGWLTTMLFVFYGWLLFRAQSLEEIVSMTRALADWSVPDWIGSYLIHLTVFIVPLVLVEAWQFKSRNRLVALNLRAWAKAVLQAVLLLAVIIYWERTHLAFIYFQF
jgi:alginate O-acetyltransferase complex protein AlgI